MADQQPPEQDQDVPQEENTPGKMHALKKMLGRPMVKLGALVILLLLLLGGTSFATLSYLGVFDEGEEPSEEIVENAASDPASQADAEASVNYYPMEPDFIVNFMARGRQRYMQLGLSLKVASIEGVGQLEMHEPLLRNSIVILLSAQDYLELQSDHGRLALREQLLESMREIMTQETGQPVVDAVFFTSYVMQ